MIWKEDKSLIRTGNAPQVWSAIANLIISLFRIHGVTSYTAETRRCAQDPGRALQILDPHSPLAWLNTPTTLANPWVSGAAGWPSVRGGRAERPMRATCRAWVPGDGEAGVDHF